MSEAEPKLSKNAAKKLAKEQKKAQFKAEKGAQNNASSQKKEEEKSDNFGELPINRSETRTGRIFKNVSEINEKLVSQEILLRARVYSTRGTGNLVFLVLRQRAFTVQAVLAKGENTPKSMLNFASRISKESIVDVEGTVIAATVESCSQKTVEIQVKKLFLISRAEPVPISVEDAARPKSVYKQQEQEIASIEKEMLEVKGALEATSEAEKKKELEAKLEGLAKKKGEAQKYVKVSRETRLNNRVIDLRAPANVAIFRLESAVGTLFREFLLAKDFQEIHSPKLLGAASEGGAEVFRLKYFGAEACLAQSPQFYKQMAVCGDMERVFEIGPVFRAENSFTHRHLCEFMGLDIEMAFNEHYHEVLDVLDGLFNFIFEGLNTRFAKELEFVQAQFPFSPIAYKYPSPRLTYPEAIAMLKGAGVTMGELEDLSTANERVLGRLVKEKYGVDFFILDKFPSVVRPFYSMVDPKDSRYCNAYDLFLRGEEICSGSQRIHDAAMLESRIKEKGISVESVKDYINAFRYGAPPHAGGGIGLARVVMLFCGLKNIRQTSLFPRDPHRITP